MDYVGEFTKQVAEQFNISIDFATHRLSTTESIVGSPTVTAILISDGSDKTSTVIDAANVTKASGVVTVPVKAGVDDADYKITVKVTTDSSPAQVHEADVKMRVRDV
jgi:hypothetical protein